MGKEYHYGLCNAVIMSEPSTPFLKIWKYHYEKMFNPLGWVESSVILPRYIADYWTEIVTALEQTYFFYPGPQESLKIFEETFEESLDQN